MRKSSLEYLVASKGNRHGNISSWQLRVLAVADAYNRGVVVEAIIIEYYSFRQQICVKACLSL